ncbi:hypothetical protein BDZ89DRAFT_1114963 [Hymenopellis radicata]|nr:hypothetical protein BDZ89DRAFT_1114963 [Hymenopellis radicata]
MSYEEPLCENLAWYIYSPDDEVRELLYGIRRTTTIPNDSGRYAYRTGSPGIFVGRDFPEEQVDFDARTLEAANKIFMCRLLDLEARAVYPDTHPSSLKHELEQAASYIDSISSDQSYIERNSVDTRTFNALATLNHLQLARCVAADTQDAIRRHCFTSPSNDRTQPGMLDSIPAYDSLFLNAWHDEPGLRTAGINISFRPRWSLYPTEASTAAELEWPVIVPDVVFSVCVRLQAHLSSARRYHPGHIFSDRDESQESTVEIPVLIVEYNKAYADSNIDVPGIDEHRNHLMAAMAAAFPLHAALGLKTPLAGLLINHEKLDALLGTLADSYGRMLPRIHNTVLVTGSSGSKNARSLILYDPWHIINIRNIIANLHESASSIAAEISALSDGLRSLDWPTNQTRQDANLEDTRRVIDTTHPSLVVEDVLLDFLFSLPAQTDINDWLEIRGLLVRAETSAKLPRDFQHWIQVFEQRTRFGNAYVEEQIEASQRGMPTRAYNLLSLFTESYRKLSISGGPPPSANDATLPFDVRCSVTFCLYARDLRGLFTDSHSLSIHWTVLYNSLFSRAWRMNDQGVNLVLQHNTSWIIHPNVQIRTREHDISHLDELRPNCAFLICLPEEHVILGKHGGSYEDLAHLMPDFTVTTYSSDGTGIHYVQMPVLVVEYVLIPNNASERSKHLAHLSIALRSALALWELHHVKAPVMGLLIDRNIVTMVLAWIDDEGQCIIREMLDYRFDVFDPYDAFRLFTLVKAHGSNAFAEQIYLLIDAHTSEALDEVQGPDYFTWKEARPTRPPPPLDVLKWRADVQNEISEPDVLGVSGGYSE